MSTSFKEQRDVIIMRQSRKARLTWAGLAVGPLAALFLLPVPNAAGEKIDPPKEYAACMVLARENPEAGFEKATLWKGLGGGSPAAHCAAVALLGLGHATDAAERLTALAQSVKAGPKFKAGLLEQAGQAWLVAGKPAKADTVFTAGINLDQANLSLLVGRAQSAAAREAFGNAVRDLDMVLDADPSRLDALIFRASAYRHLNKMGPAAEDIGRALLIQPDHPEGLLERGILRRLFGDDPGARRDWLLVIEIAKETPAAQAAQANLQRLDGGVK